MLTFDDYRLRMDAAVAVYDAASAEVDRIEDAALATWRRKQAGRDNQSAGPTPDGYALARLADGGDYTVACSRRASAQQRVIMWALAALVTRAAGPGDADHRTAPAPPAG